MSSGNRHCWHIEQSQGISGWIRKGEENQHLIVERFSDSSQNMFCIAGQTNLYTIRTKTVTSDIYVELEVNTSCPVSLIPEDFI